jgi:phospholipid/cholesterol/gamma-HCH transport system substrate-binding protein
MRPLRRNADAPRVPRKDRRGASPFAVGAAVLALIAALTYLGFTKHVPFTHGFRVDAVFESANSIRENSPVRIAGVNVGKVKKIARKDGSDAAVLTLELDKQGLPLHKDATAKIRPRIFLEGNFFVDLQPGTPSSPKLGDGDTIPITQTSTPVQFDQVLTTLQADTRRQLQRLLDGLGTGLTAKPTAAEDASADPSARGQTAAESLNDAIPYGKPALEGTAIVAQALQGSDPHDLSRLIKGLSRTTEGLGRNERQLEDLVVNFNRTVAATADRATDLRSSVRLLAPTLASADRALDALNAAFPDTRAFAREILPGVRETAATIDAGFPWVRQARGLVSPGELQGWVRALSPATTDLAKVIDTSTRLLPQADLAAKCVAQVVLPTGDVKISDPPLSTNTENYKELLYGLVGLTGEGQNFDGNGPYVRFQTGGGDAPVAVPLGGERNFANAAVRPLGTRPAYPGKKPPYRPTAPCYRNGIPNLNGAATGPSDALRP